MSICPCRVLEETEIDFQHCCGPLLEGGQSAQTAEALMRSRYVAYVMKNIDYIDETQTSSKEEDFDKDEALRWAESSDWMGLEIKRTEQGTKKDSTGLVEFVARYRDKQSGSEHQHHETAYFVNDNENWRFTVGKIHGLGPVVRSSPKVGRNDPCLCGSGKKYKKCCGA